MAADPKLKIKITVDGREYQAELDRVIDRTESVGKTAEQAAGGVMQLQRYLKLAASAAAAYGAIALGRQIVDVSANFQRLSATLESVLGSQEAAADAMQRIQDIAATTPFQVSNLTDVFIRLKAFGLDPLDGTLQAIIDQSAALGGSQEQLEGIALALGQAWAKQKLQGEEILQLIERGVPVWEILQDVTGRNVQELQKLSERGELGRDVIKALMDEMGRRTMGAAAKQAETLNGALSNMQDAVSRLLNKLGSESGFIALVREASIWVARFADTIAGDDGSARAVEIFNEQIKPNINLLKEMGVYLGALDPSSLEDVMRVVEAAQLQGVNLELEASLRRLERQIQQTANRLDGLYQAQSAIEKLGTKDQAQKNAEMIARQEEALRRLADQYIVVVNGLDKQAEAQDATAESAASLADRYAIVESEVRAAYTSTDEFRDAMLRLNAVFLMGDLSAETYSRRMRQLAEQYDMTAAGGDQAAAEIAKRNMLMRETERVVQQTMTAEQRYAEEVRQLNELWQLGADPKNREMGIGIDTETYVRAIEQANQRILNSARATTSELQGIWRGTGYQISYAIGQSVGQAVIEQKKGLDVLRQMGRRVLTDLIAQLTAFMVRKAALWAVEKAGIFGAAAASSAAGAATATAWAPAAAAVSLATMGGNAPLAAAGIASTYALTKTLALAGVAHDGLEYVPREGTYLLAEGERVVNKEDNKKLSDALEKTGQVTVVQNFTFSAIDTRGMQELLMRMAPSIEQIAMNGMQKAAAMSGRGGV